MTSLTDALTAESGLPIFVFVDPLPGEPIRVALESVLDLALVAQARERAWMRPVCPITLAHTIQLPLHLHPYLVAMQDADDPWLAHTLQIASEERMESQREGIASSGSVPHRIGGWLQSNLSPLLLANALSALMQVNTQAPVAERYQRVADRRVFAWLRQVVGDARLASHLGRIQRWCYLDVCGRLAQVRSSHDDASTLRLTQSEWASFSQGKLLHPAAARWLGERALLHDLDDANFISEEHVYERVRVALEQAGTAAKRWPQRFTKPQDRIAWAVLTLLHPKIEQHTAVIMALDAHPEIDQPADSIDAMSPMLNAMLKAAP